MWMNEYDIDDTVRLIHDRHPRFYPYARYLSDWRDIVNRNSDGWPYWSGGSRPARKLMELLDQTVRALRGWPADRGATLPDEKDLRKALAPIKACATRHKLPVPELVGD